MQVNNHNHNEWHTGSMLTLTLCVVTCRAVMGHTNPMQMSPIRKRVSKARDAVRKALEENERRMQVA